MGFSTKVVLKGQRMSEDNWNVLKITSLVIALMGVTALVMTIMMGHSGVQGY